MYVIGGLIDRNRHKGVCFKKAQELGCAAAKLPVRDVVEMSGSHVLTVNQVIQILSRSGVHYGDGHQSEMWHPRGGEWVRLHE